MLMLTVAGVAVSVKDGMQIGWSWERDGGAHRTETDKVRCRLRVDCGVEMGLKWEELGLRPELSYG